MVESKNNIYMRDYVDAKFDAIEKAADARFDAIGKAMDDSTAALNKRLEGMNEFREALKDQTSKHVSRAECTILHDRINADLGSLRESRAALEGKASQRMVIFTLGLTIFSIFLSLLSIILKVVLR